MNVGLMVGAGVLVGATVIVGDILGVSVGPNDGDTDTDGEKVG